MYVIRLSVRRDCGVAVKRLLLWWRLCGGRDEPFKLALEVQNYFTYLNQLPTAFGDKKVTCLFVCNSSNDWRWRYNMAYFNMFGDNYIHYRLTGKEKDAIGQSFDLGRSVSYRLITPGGQLLPAEVPSPRNYINLKRMLDEL